MHTKEILGEGKYYKLVRRNNWEYIEPVCFSDVVLIVPVTDDGKLVLVEQHRVPTGLQVFEIPAGLVGDKAEHGGEEIISAARRELIEETGYDADEIIVSTQAAPSAGSNTLVVSMLLATGLKKVGPGGGNPDEGEDIIVHEVPLDDVHSWLEEKRRGGAAVDLKVYAGLFFAIEYYQNKLAQQRFETIG